MTFLLIAAGLLALLILATRLSPGGGTTTNLAFALKENYAKRAPEIIIGSKAQNSPLLAKLERKKTQYDPTGRKFIAPLVYGTGESVGPDFPTAQTKALSATTGSAIVGTRWEVPATVINGVAAWDRMVIDSIQGDHALFDLAEKEMDMKIQAMRGEIVRHIPGDGWGSLGRILAITSSSITVAKYLVPKFRVGMDIVAAATLGSGALLSSTALTVVGGNPDTGVITLSGDPTALSWTAAAGGSYLFRAGGRQNTGSPTQQYFYGLKAWLNTGIPGDTFCNVVRNGWELAGLSYNCASIAPKTALIKMAARSMQYGNTPKTAFISATDYAVLADSLDTAAKTVKVEAKEFGLSWNALSLNTPTGELEIIGDPFIDDGDCFMGDFEDPDAIYLAYANDLVNIDDVDGNVFLRSATAASYECRLYSVLQLIVAAPGRFMRGYSFNQ